MVVRNNELRRDPTVSEKTPEEINFALQVEQLLDSLVDPAERQIVVECLLVISEIETRNKEIRIGSKDLIDLVAIVLDAYKLFWNDWIIAEGPRVFGFMVQTAAKNDTKPARQEISRLKLRPDQVIEQYPFSEYADEAKRLFYDLQQDGSAGTMSYLAKAVFRTTSYDIDTFLSTATTAKEQGYEPTLGSADCKQM